MSQVNKFLRISRVQQLHDSISLLDSFDEPGVFDIRTDDDVKDERLSSIFNELVQINIRREELKQELLRYGKETALISAEDLDNIMNHLE